MLHANGTEEAVPQRAADLTADWLSSVLCPGMVDNRVTSLQVEGLGGGEQGIAGDLARVALTYERDAPGLPTAVIAKFAPMAVELRRLLNSLGFFQRELGFYERLAGRTPVPTPRCYFRHLDQETGHFVLLLEDLAPARVGNTVRGSSLEEVTTVLAAAAKLHAAWWQDPTLIASDWLRLRSMLAPAAMTTTFAQAWPSFVRKLGTPMSAQLVQERDWIAENLDQAAQRSYESAPRTLIHNDLQLDNLFFGDDPARPVVFIDWQMVTVGRGVVDAASLIRGSLALEARQGVESGLVRAYHAALLQGGVPGYSIDQCLEDYQLASVLAPARLVNAVGFNESLSAHPGAFWDALFPRLGSAPIL
jgi:hypothetical protein